MPVLTPIPTEVSSVPTSAAEAAGPVCSLQRVAPQGAPGQSASLWQLGIEAQELTTAIGLLAEQLEADDHDTSAQALAELEAALLAEEGNKAALAAKADATCWVIEHLRGQAAYRQQQAKRLTELSRSDAGRADALEESLVLVLTRPQPTATRFSQPAGQDRHQGGPQGRPPHPRRPARLPPLLAHPLTGQGPHLVHTAGQLGGADHPQARPPAFARSHPLQRAALLGADRATAASNLHPLIPVPVPPHPPSKPCRAPSSPSRSLPCLPPSIAPRCVSASRAAPRSPIWRDGK
ncbi:hypothetical protein [Cyanobium sp. BSA11S]|uniref:hypothetical protein n=1 Tax=Cyanobium sp. BSA11S TaxID=3108224 RepID=UPI003D816FA6